VPESEIPEYESSFLVENLDQGNLVHLLDELEGSDHVDKKDNSTIYAEIRKEFDAAKESMDNWRKKYAKALALSKLVPKDSDGKEIASKDFPFEGASTAMLPYILEAMLDFHGRAVPELVWSNELVKAKVVGGIEQLPPFDAPPPPEGAPESVVIAYQQAQQEYAQNKQKFDTQQQQKEDRAERVSEFSNYQLSNDIPLWKESTDKALLSLPCVGTYYKKTYRS
jgi:hypothetical protein